MGVSRASATRLLLGAAVGAFLLSSLAAVLGAEGPFPSLLEVELDSLRGLLGTSYGTVGWWAGFVFGGLLGARLTARVFEKRKISWGEALDPTLNAFLLLLLLSVAIAAISAAARR